MIANATRLRLDTTAAWRTSARLLANCDPLESSLTGTEDCAPLNIVRSRLQRSDVFARNSRLLVVL
jgi:hypothetical protein